MCVDDKTIAFRITVIGCRVKNREYDRPRSRPMIRPVLGASDRDHCNLKVDTFTSSKTETGPRGCDFTAMSRCLSTGGFANAVFRPPTSDLLDLDSGV